MASLMSQRRDLESRLEQAVRLQSPVLRLPSELFRYWLEVALSTPVLWAKISVSPHDSLEKARRKLGRSKSCPLDITINFGPRTEYTSSVTEQVVHAMDLFRPALWRTKSFRLSVPNRPQAHAVLLRCQQDAPLLETLSIRIYHAMQDDNYSIPPLPLFNGRTPRLRSCSLTSFNFGWDVRLVSRLRILRECPQLEELALRNLSDVDCAPCFSHSEDFDFLRLVLLCWHRLDAATYGQFSSKPGISRTVLPGKRHPSSTTLVYQALTRLPLRLLRIESSLFNELKLVSLLRRLPSLVTLELVDVETPLPASYELAQFPALSNSTHYLLQGLSSSQPWVCPKLESLALDGPPHMHDHGLIPRSLYPAVYLGPLRLRAIDVTRCNQISKEMVQWLRMYVAEVKCERAKGVWGEPMP
ncbi:hypothetical protein B0H10DRAFT_2311524 [Mycena sp. CBHHK59/15]|nr:hypothetical protein B0H10DRAFT_2311524 [Mycena sp. CBHHK59/15]